MIHGVDDRSLGETRRSAQKLKRAVGKPGRITNFDAGPIGYHGEGRWESQRNELWILRKCIIGRTKVALPKFEIPTPNTKSTLWLEIRPASPVPYDMTVSYKWMNEYE